MKPPTIRPATAQAARPLMICLVTALTWLLTFSPAAAHDQLLSTDPADGATVPEAPTSIRLTFNAAVIAMGSEVAVTGPEGPVTTGPPQLASHDLIVSLPDIQPGQYDVAWRAVSSDGHPISGSFAFTVADPDDTTPTNSPTAPPADATPPPAPGEVEADPSPLRWIVPAGIAIVVVVAALAWRRSRR